MVLHIVNSGPLETEADGSPWVRGKPGLYSFRTARATQWDHVSKPVIVFIAQTDFNLQRDPACTTTPWFSKHFCGRSFKFLYLCVCVLWCGCRCQRTTLCSQLVLFHLYVDSEVWTQVARLPPDLQNKQFAWWGIVLGLPEHFLWSKIGPFPTWSLCSDRDWEQYSQIIRFQNNKAPG